MSVVGHSSIIFSSKTTLTWLFTEEPQYEAQATVDVIVSVVHIGVLVAKCVHQVVHLRQPEVFLSTREEWNFSLWSSSKVELFHPEWGMITVLVRVVKASRMIVILTASHDDRFHSTPAETPAHKHRHWETGTQTSSYVSCHVQLG